MSEFFGFIIFELLFNFIGAVIRWIFGSVWRKILGKPKFKFSEYLNGPKNPDHFDNQSHDNFNVIIGVFFTIAIVLLIIVLNRI